MKKRRARRSSRGRPTAAICSCVASLLLSVFLRSLPAHEDGAPPGHTGGFGEPTCRSCHFDRPLNPPGYSLFLDGLPDVYEPGHRYALTVRLEPAPPGAGFAMSARLVQGPLPGTQAGRLIAEGDEVAVDELPTGAGAGHATVQFARQTAKGNPPGPPGWKLTWIAPPQGAVVFHLAANAADGDSSAIGDRIYTLEKVVRPRAASRAATSPHFRRSRVRTESRGNSLHQP